jgi:hypothetical protein
MNFQYPKFWERKVRDRLRFRGVNGQLTFFGAHAALADAKAFAAYPNKRPSQSAAAATGSPGAVGEASKRLANLRAATRMMIAIGRRSG